MNKKIALVTNVLDYVGPPAVKALLKGGYDVIAQDPAFQDTNKEKEYKIIFPGTVPLGIKDPRELIQYVWDNNKKVDVLTLISPVVDWKFIDLKIVENPQKCLKLGE